MLNLHNLKFNYIILYIFIEEEEDFGPKTYRTDGYWYRNAFRILGKFVNKLKLDMVMSKL